MSALPMRPRPGRDALFAGLLLLVTGVVGTVALRQTGPASAPVPGGQIPSTTFVPPMVLRGALSRADGRLFGGRPIVRTYLQTGSRPAGSGVAARPQQAKLLPGAMVSALLGTRRGGAIVAVQEEFGPAGPSSGERGLGWMVLATSQVPVNPISLADLPKGTQHAVRVWATRSEIPLRTVSVWPFRTVTLVYGGVYGHALADLLPAPTRAG